jgi:HEAT repeat protein
LKVKARLLAGLTALFGIARDLIHRTSRERTARWRVVAELCQLTEVEESRSFGVDELTGRSNGLRVRFTTYQRGKRERGTRVLVTAGAGELDWLKLRREDLGTALQEVLGAREVELGDEAFDREFFVDGPAALTRAVFDAETRSVLHWLNADARLELLDGELRAEVGESSSTDLHDRLGEVAPRLLDAARRLIRPTDVARRLAHNALRDPKTNVRLECLLLLTREFPKDHVTRETLVEAARDPGHEIRLRAAMALGEDGHEVLLALATSGPDEYGARAVAVLDRHLGLERALAVLETALRDRHVQTARAALAILGRTGNPEAVRSLAQVMAVEQEDLATAAAHALGTSRQEIAEAPLLEALGRKDPAALRVAAAEALGRCASTRAVLPLKEVEARHPFDMVLRRAARHAVAEIQARIMGASPGQLSLAAGDSGHLSLAVEDAGGRLSVPPAEPPAPPRKKEDPPRG